MPRCIIGTLQAFSACALALTLSGCIGTWGIAPQTQTLQANTLSPSAAIEQAAADAHWPDQQWWRAYRDPQLDHWIALALAANPSLAIAAARVRQARALAGLAESAEHLQGTGRATLNRHNWPDDPFYGPGDLSGATTWDNNASLGLSYALDLWGRERNASEQAVDQAHRQAAEARQAQLELQHTVVSVYIELSLHYARRDIIKAQLAQQEQILDLAQRRLDAGIGTHLEVSQAQAPLPETHRQLDSLDEDIALATHQLAALAGKGPGEGAQLQRPSLTLAAPLTLPARL
ncbi:TolC family protein, partial [Pseudomonas sp. UBA2522]|uniref:TolC family protein n=1 Tax=Pseudomonas sp. UBA2522 TaxID=1947309 RepID=UPI00257EDBC6